MTWSSWFNSCRSDGGAARNKLACKENSVELVSATASTVPADLDLHRSQHLHAASGHDKHRTRLVSTPRSPYTVLPHCCTIGR
ncbi:hypothetical protein RRG08_066935 [Elysia crispata]|uniref:Uncharacterized protein n=1 Tax=Elysia crispata TaxID=231223 RepID=A0AAE1ANZ3_9GAST|nr:hypothetical protein RRG08_066935 [Elysia crispata]